MNITITFPEDSKLLVKEGQKVDFTTPFITQSTLEEVKVTLSSMLGFPPDKIFLYLHKFVGEKVEKDELLAERKAMLSTKQYYCEHTGTIKEINHYDGSVTIESQMDETSEYPCYFKGTIEQIDKTSLILKVGKAKEIELQEKSHHFGGAVFYYKEEMASTVTEDDVIDTVVVAERIPVYDQVKLEALGAKGFITIEPLLEQPSVPSARLKKISDLKDVASHAISCCMITPDSTTIYFYD